MKKYFVGLRYHDAVAWHMLKDAVGTRSAILITVLACAAGTDPQAASIYASSAWYVQRGTSVHSTRLARSVHNDIVRIVD